jgi:acyl-CoA reductase-like NAD-dependent aldehyde dehydrogenase
MKLYVEPMDAFVVEVREDGRVRFDDEGEFSKPSLQERRAILYAAANEIDALKELIEVLQAEDGGRSR